MTLNRAKRLTLFRAETDLPYPIRFEDLTPSEQAEAIQVAHNLLAITEPINESTLGLEARKRLETLVNKWSQVSAQNSL